MVAVGGKGWKSFTATVRRPRSVVSGRRGLALYFPVGVGKKRGEERRERRWFVIWKRSTL